jgi:hypothetical protein
LLPAPARQWTSHRARKTNRKIARELLAESPRRGLD